MEHQPQRIRNPFAGVEGYHCFGCDPESPVGLKLEFFVEGNELVMHWRPQPQFEGYPGVIHGGIQATLADEAAAWYVYTREMSIRYAAPARTQDGPFTVRASGALRDERSADVHVQLYNAAGEVCTEADCDYVVFPEPVARRRFAYPGRDAFFGPPE